MRKVKKYKIRYLIDGYRVDQKFKGMALVAVPKHLFEEAIKVQVIYQDDYMMLSKESKPLKELDFHDKFGRDKYYTLCYFEWRPEFVQFSLLNNLELLAKLKMKAKNGDTKADNSVADKA